MNARRWLVLGLVALAARPARAQCPDGAPPPCAGRGGRTAAAPSSVAVLSFENLSRDTNDLYLADGITEELTSRLGAVTRLRVTGRSVVRRAQQAAGGDVLAAGRALNVRYLVEGSVRRAGPRVRISARLLRASDGLRVWGDDYDRTMDDLLSLQEDIARDVAGNVAGQLLPAEQRVLSRRPTASAEAWDHYLRGRYLVTRRTAAAIQQADDEFATALRLDPRFTAALARRATTMVLAYGYGVPLGDIESVTVRARQLAERAVQLDSAASDAWLAIGLVQCWFEPVDYERCRAAFGRAVALDPRNAEAHHTLGLMIGAIPDDSAAAVASLRRALALEPTRAVSLLDIAQIRYAQRNYRDALLLADSGIALDANQGRLYLLRGSVRAVLGDRRAARQDAETALGVATPIVRLYALTQLIGLDVQAGDSVTARARLEEIAASPFAVTPSRALALAHLGMADSALAVLRRGPVLPIDWTQLPMPEYDPLRALPGYRQAMERWRLPRLRL